MPDQVRRGLIRCGATVAAVALMMASCAKPPESQMVADRFMELYYTRMDVAEAVKLCSGSARAKLESELQAIQGVKPDSAAGEPEVTFSLTASSNSLPAEASYTYVIDAHTSDIGKRSAILILDDQDGHWLVTSLTENDGAPPS